MRVVWFQIIKICFLCSANILFSSFVILLLYSAVLPGNKCDMETLREVEFAEAEAMCEYIPEILYVMETSARENTNVEQVFMCLATELKVQTQTFLIFVLEGCRIILSRFFVSSMKLCFPKLPCKKSNMKRATSVK